MRLLTYQKSDVIFLGTAVFVRQFFARGDRPIASVTVDGDCAIDSFVLKDGKVYDSMLRIVNVADHAVKLTLPSGYVYETFKGVKPLTIPANSRNVLSITRTAAGTFLVSREELETVQ